MRAPAFGQLSDEEQATAAFVEYAGSAEMGAGAAAVGDFTDEAAVAYQP